MRLQTFKLSKDGSINNKTTDALFPDGVVIETLTTDNDGGYECEKEGTGDQPNQDLLNRVQDNIRERFALEGAEPDNDEDDY